MPFQAKITRARFVLGPFSAEQMQTIGNVMRDTIAERIQSGINCNDGQAKPLKPGRNGKRGYPDYKIARGIPGIRNWIWTGRTMRSLKVKAVSENRVTIGFVDPQADAIAHYNNRREKQFGVSPKDRMALGKIVMAVLRQARIVRVKRAA
jgi:hypothetical protein